MAQAKRRTATGESTEAGLGLAGMAGQAGERAKVNKRMRPVFSEVARLSATLGIARQACYTGEPDKAVKALQLLVKQLSLALETAELLAPSSDE